MREAWRWFGPGDPVSLDDIRQAGATDIVSALHHIPIGKIWPLEEIGSYKDLIEGTPEGLSPLCWSVVESVPVHEDVKLAAPGHEKYVQAFIGTMKNLAACDIKTICYNFMPVIDWTRTDLEYALPTGARTLRFDYQRFAAFDLFILQRGGAESDYAREDKERAKSVFAKMSNADREQLSKDITAGLPGRMTDTYDLDEFRGALARYQGVSKDDLRRNLLSFLGKILPVAEELGIKLAIHPDDPPYDLLGLPRVVCTASDLDELFKALPSPANGLTLCVGTFGSRPDNDLPEMAKRFASRIFFSHLRGVKRDKDDPRSFYESAHLESDVDIIAVIKNLLEEEGRRKRDPDYADLEIPIRPDHGHQMMDDLKKDVNPGYSAIGRLKGLAEIRGVLRTLERFENLGQ